MAQPNAFVTEGENHLACKFNQSIYQLKQLPRCWNTVHGSHLKEMGLPSKPHIYIDAGQNVSYV